MTVPCCGMVLLTGICSCPISELDYRRLRYARLLVRSGRLSEWPKEPPAPRSSDRGDWLLLAFAVAVVVAASLVLGLSA